MPMGHIASITVVVHSYMVLTPFKICACAVSWYKHACARTTWRAGGGGQRDYETACVLIESMVCITVIMQSHTGNILLYKHVISNSKSAFGYTRMCANESLP